MPFADTFSVKPIGDFVRRWLNGAPVIVDPFARNSKIGTTTNDLNPETSAEHHLEAGDFCAMLLDQGIVADAVLFDPPYSPRQISECYQSIGKPVGMKDTQNGRLYREIRDGLDRLLRPGGTALSFGWNSSGFGLGRGYQIQEILLVSHGAAHNDTICVAERKIQGNLF